ncbi:hypothetical protein HK099_005068 [Clydaea vesicula]|uniref:Uncharacterized protein n=1 Tax=Clydaea vesicula TaxID=447962 RepID=A0AAD5XXU0_9FUNG|nr:hypothetical protein HK099_005068 [Clydaea vesicula]
MPPVSLWQVRLMIVWYKKKRERVGPNRIIIDWQDPDWQATMRVCICAFLSSALYTIGLTIHMNWLACYIYHYPFMLVVGLDVFFYSELQIVRILKIINKPQYLSTVRFMAVFLAVALTLGIGAEQIIYVVDGRCHFAHGYYSSAIYAAVIAVIDGATTLFFAYLLWKSQVSKKEKSSSLNNLILVNFIISLVYIGTSFFCFFGSYATQSEMILVNYDLVYDSFVGLLANALRIGQIFGYQAKKKKKLETSMGMSDTPSETDKGWISGSTNNEKSQGLNSEKSSRIQSTKATSEMFGSECENSSNYDAGMEEV